MRTTFMRTTLPKSSVVVAVLLCAGPLVPSSAYAAGSTMHGSVTMSSQGGNQVVQTAQLAAQSSRDITSFSSSAAPGRLSKRPAHPSRR